MTTLEAPILDAQLLTAFCAQADQSSFSALVRRYLPLVYSAALRQVHDPATAEDVTQAVFILLARKAPELNPHTTLCGWLLRATHFYACDALNRARRRRDHERKAAAMRSDIAPPHTWDDVAPHLDTAMAMLSASIVPPSP